METPVAFYSHLRTLHQDGIIWKAKKLWNGAQDPDEQATAMDQLVTTMLSIRNEVKRTSYIDMCQAELGIKKRLLAKQVKDETDRRAKELANKKAKAQIEGKIAANEVSGLPDEFQGNLFDALKYGIYEHNGVYYSRAARGADVAISNFTMKVHYHIQTADDHAFRMLSIKNVYGFEKMILINTDDLVSIGSFKKVIARFGDFIFKGGDSDLSRLQEYLQRDEKRTVFIKTLGYNKRGKFYSFANGIIPPAETSHLIPVDKYGIVFYNEKNYVIPALSEMYIEKDELYANEKKFIYTAPLPEFGWHEWCGLFTRSYGNKGQAAILFYLGSLFRDIIMKEVGRYPLLNLFGPPGSGKGEVATSLMALFGEPQDQIMLGGASTVVGFMRKFAQFCNSIVWLDEYKNNLAQKVIESIKNLYDGKGYERGKMTNDFTTESTPIFSSCILSGQDMPTIEPALFMRCIMLAFQEGKFSADQRKAFTELKKKQHNGLSYITGSLVNYRNLVEEKFKEKYSQIFSIIMKEVDNPEIEDRMFSNVASLLAMYDIFHDILKFPFTYSEVKKWLLENMRNQHLILAGNNDLAKFWGIMESLFHQDVIIEGKDFHLQDGNLYLSLEQVHGYYLKEMIQRRDNNYLSKGTLEHYFKINTTSFIKHDKKRFPDGSNKQAWIFKYNKLGIDLIKIKTEGLTDDQKQLKLNEKYREMGVNDKVEEMPEVPGGIWKPLPGENFDSPM
jgi:hypothetical protein